MTRMRILAIALGSAALTASAVALTPALGQDPASSLRGHDTDAPVDVAADRIEVQDRADRVIFSGNVVARQADLEISAPRVTLAYADTSGIEIRRIDASGGVTMRSPSETARGEFAVYDVGARLLTLVGGVTLTRGDSHVSGGRLVLDLDSGRAVMDGGGPAPAGAPPGTETAPTGRVTGRFTVPRRDPAPR